MRIKPLRYVLMATTGISIAMIALVGGWALTGGSDDVPQVSIPLEGNQDTTASQTNLPKEPKRFDQLWNLTLQEPRSQRSTQTVQPASVKPTNVGFGIKLVGTILEPSKSLALFRDETGKFDLKGVGQSLALSPAGAQIDNIERNTATLRYEGREIRLEPTAMSAAAQRLPDYMNGNMQQGYEDPNAQGAMAPEPMNFMTPMSPADMAPNGEEDPFAPLPAHMNPYGSPPPAPMEPQP